MFQVVQRAVAILIVLTSVWTSSTVFGESSPKHEVSEEKEESTSKVKEAKEKIVTARPPVAAIGKILQGISPQMSQERFSQLVEQTRGLNDAQKSAIKNSFQSVASELRSKGQGDKANEEFTRILGGALAELDVPEEGKAKESASAAAQTGQPGQGQPGQPAQPQIPEELKAVQEQLKKSQEERGKEISRLRESLAERDRKAREEGKGRGADNGQGQGAQNPQGQGQNPGGGNPGGGDGGGAGGGGRALSQIAKALGNKGNNNSNQGSSNNGGSNSNGNGNGNDNQKQDRNQGRGATGSSAKDLAPAASSDDSDTKKKKETKTDDSAANNLLNSQKDTGPVPYVPKGGLKLSGNKSSLQAIQKGGYGGGGFGGGFGGGNFGADFGPGPGQLGGAKIMGNGGGGGLSGGGGGDLSGMRFDSDSFAGPQMGLPKFGGGPVYGDAGGGNATSEGSGNGLEGELAAQASATDAFKLRSIPNSEQIDMSARTQLDQGNILDKNFGKVIRTVCGEASPNQVSLCYHPRARAIVQKTAMGSI